MAFKLPENTLLYHNSRLLSCRRPFGAVTCGTDVTLRAFAGDKLWGARVLLRLWLDESGEQLIEMPRDGVGFIYTLKMPDYPTIVWYYFIIEKADGHRLYYGADSGEGDFYTHEPPHSFRVTVYDAAYRTPAWFQDAIAYQVFPDRFRRSSHEDMHARADHLTALGRKVRLHELWNEPPEFRAAPGEDAYCPQDYFGGDLNGIRAKLNYLASLGVTCLYLNPIFEAASNHRYNTADYLHVDPMLGTDEEFRTLCREAKALGIRIMLDGVFSHTGSDSRYFNREGHYSEPGAWQGPASPYYEWYTFYDFPYDYECWWNFDSLPNVKELTPSYVEFIAGEHGVLSKWASYGATSWRLDVADELPDGFIRELRKRVKKNDPEGVLLGEVWEECSAKRGPEGRRGYVNGDELDSAMDYPFADAVIAFLNGEAPAQKLSRDLQALREWYPEPFYRAQLNLLSSHDVMRAITALSGAPSRHTTPREQQAVWRPTDEQDRVGRARFLLATAVQMFLPGVPCIYYGDEAGMTGMADPFNRQTYPWGHEDTAIRDRVTELAHLRRDRAVLHGDRMRMGALSQDVFVLARYTEDEAAVLLINRGRMEATVTLPEDAFAEGPDAETPMPLDGDFTDERGTPCGAVLGVPLTVPPLGAVIRIREKA